MGFEEDRIVALETALAHAEAEIADIAETARAHWAEIEALKAEIGRLTRSLEAMLEDRGDAPPPDAKPPHY